MALRNYFHYFNFIRKNWNFRLAFFTLWHELRGERKYKIHTSGFNNLQKEKVLSKNKPAAYIYQPVNYYMGERAFDYISSQKTSLSITDFGCGMGRIMVIAAHYGFKTITGVEFAPSLCRKAEENIRLVKQQFPDIKATIYCGDAIDYPIKEEEVFSFFNPFDERVMLPVVRNILKSLKEYPRDVYILYFNPTEKEIFLSAGFVELWYYSKMEYLDFSILFKKKEVENWDL